MLVPRFAEMISGDRLDLRGWQLGPEGARALAEHPSLAAVRVLKLTGNRIGDDGLAALLRSAKLGPLRDLHLAENQLTADAVHRLATTPMLVSVSDLDLANNALGPAAMTSLAPLLPRLEILDVCQNQIGDAGCRALADGQLRCEELGLSFTGLGPAGLAALVDSGALANTHSLQLTGNPLGDAGAEALARLATPTNGFSTVALGWTGLSVRGLALLLDANVFANGIGHLELRGNSLGDAGWRLLIEHPNLPNCTLDLDDGPAKLVVALRARTRVIVSPALNEGRLLACPFCYEAIDFEQPLCPHCRLDASRDAPTDEDEQRHRAAERRPCPHCGGSIHARSAERCPHCASWVVSMSERARYG